MTRKYIKSFMSVAIAICSFSAHAGVIKMDYGNAVANPSHTENFDGGIAANNITNQFSENGVTFKTLGDAGISLISNSICTNSGMSGKYLAMGMRTPCNGNTAFNAVSMMFDGDVESLSWTGFNRTIFNGFKVEFWNDGKIIESATDAYFMSPQNLFSNKTVLVSGGVFDEIRFIESTGYQGFFGIDNMAWKIAPAVVKSPVSDVPEPNIALLFGIGAVGMAYKRKTRKFS
jgi:hypothetical protein